MSPMRPTVLLPAIVLSGVAAGPVSGQLLTLDSPDRAFPQSFAIVQTVRELPDGRVLVADPLRRLLAIVDFDGGTMEPVGHEGTAPPGTGHRTPSGHCPATRRCWSTWAMHVSPDSDRTWASVRRAPSSSPSPSLDAR